MMKMKMLWAVLTAVALGALNAACLWTPDDSLGKLCAAPASGEEYCVESDHDPAAAWSQAEAHGAMPIQMWAKWPSRVSLDELVESRDRLTTWFGDFDRVVSYVRDTERNAESTRASLDGNMGVLLREASLRQEERLAEKPIDATGNFERAITDKANGEKSPLLATIAADKQAMAAVDAVFEQARNDAAPLKERFASVVTRFTDYRATEAAETAAYVSLAEQASASALDTIDGIEQAILAAAHDASGKPNDLAVDVMTLSAELQTFAVSTQTALAPHADFLATHGAVSPDMTSGALRSLDAMLGYVQRRVARGDATTTSLLSGIAMRRQALVLLQADQVTRDTAARARLLRASSDFSEGARARAVALRQASPVSARLKLPYLASRCGQLKALLQLEPLCETSSSSWREGGCASLRERFAAAKSYLATTMPQEIRTGLATMRARGVDAGLLDAAQARLDAGDVAGAVRAYDAAVRSAEGA
jgi:hypothetical protein